jgi:hypothetical protein
MSLVDALQRALAIEHQVIYGYGVLGARLATGGRGTLPGAPPDQLETEGRLEQHKVLRDRLAGLLLARHQTPTAAAAAYQLPFAVTNTQSARKLAAGLENSVTEAAYDVISLSRPDSNDRRLMIAALAGAADWYARWTLAMSEPSAVPFPGRPGQPGASQPSTTPTSSSS